MFNEYASKNKLELHAIKDEAILLNKETRQAFEKFQKDQQDQQERVDDEQDKKLEQFQRQMNKMDL